MKASNHLLPFLVLLSAAAVSFAQSAVSPAKIGIINSYAFGDEKNGITRYVNGARSVDAEFKAANTELDQIQTRLQVLSKEIDDLRKAAADGKAVTGAQEKIDEAEKLQRDYKYKTEDAKRRYDKRTQEVMGPIMVAIGKGLQDFAKQRGLTIIFDIAKDESGLILAIGDDKIDLTKEFIAYYNTLPSGAAQ